MKDLGIIQGLKDWFLNSVREESIFIRSLIATDQRLQAFLLPQHPVEQAQLASWDFDTIGHVNSRIQRKLNTFYEMEYDRILKPSVPDQLY